METQGVYVDIQAPLKLRKQMEKKLEETLSKIERSKKNLEGLKRLREEQPKKLQMPCNHVRTNHLKIIPPTYRLSNTFCPLQEDKRQGVTGSSSSPPRTSEVTTSSLEHHPILNTLDPKQATPGAHLTPACTISSPDHPGLWNSRAPASILYTPPPSPNFTPVYSAEHQRSTQYGTYIVSGHRNLIVFYPYIADAINVDRREYVATEAPLDLGAGTTEYSPEPRPHPGYHTQDQVQQTTSQGTRVTPSQRNQTITPFPSHTESINFDVPLPYLGCTSTARSITEAPATQAESKSSQEDPQTASEPITLHEADRIGTAGYTGYAVYTDHKTGISYAVEPEIKAPTVDTRGLHIEQTYDIKFDKETEALLNMRKRSKKTVGNDHVSPTKQAKPPTDQADDSAEFYDPNETVYVDNEANSATEATENNDQPEPSFFYGAGGEDQYRQADEESMDDSQDSDIPETPDNGPNKEKPNSAMGDSLSGQIVLLDTPSNPIPNQVQLDLLAVRAAVEKAGGWSPKSRRILINKNLVSAKNEALDIGDEIFTPERPEEHTLPKLNSRDLLPPSSTAPIPLEYEHDSNDHEFCQCQRTEMSDSAKPAPVYSTFQLKTAHVEGSLSNRKTHIQTCTMPPQGDQQELNKRLNGDTRGSIREYSIHIYREIVREERNKHYRCIKKQFAKHKTGKISHLVTNRVMADIATAWSGLGGGSGPRWGPPSPAMPGGSWCS